MNYLENNNDKDLQKMVKSIKTERSLITLIPALDRDKFSYAKVGIEAMETPYRYKSEEIAKQLKKQQRQVMKNIISNKKYNMYLSGYGFKEQLDC